MQYHTNLSVLVLAENDILRRMSKSNVTEEEEKDITFDLIR